MTTGIEIARNPRFAADDLDYNFGTGKDACLQWDTAETNDALKLGLKVNNAAFSGNFIILNKDHIGSDTGLAASADPRLVVWSGDDPAAGGANEYLSLLHNRTDAVIATGPAALFSTPLASALWSPWPRPIPLPTLMLSTFGAVTLRASPPSRVAYWY